MSILFQGSRDGDNRMSDTKQVKPRTIIRKAHNKENPYAQISKSLLRDNRLSAKSMGIMCYLLGLPDHWRLCIEELAKHFSDGQKSIKSGLKQLEKLGYIERFQHRHEGGVFGVIEMLIHEEPIFATPAIIDVSPRAQKRPAVSPLAQKRPAVKRPAVNGMLVNTHEVKTDHKENIQQEDVVVSDINCFERRAKMDELKKLGVSEEMIERILKNFPITRIAYVISMYHEEGGEGPGFIVHALKTNRQKKQNKELLQAANVEIDHTERLKHIEESHKQEWQKRIESYAKK